MSTAISSTPVAIASPRLIAKVAAVNRAGHLANIMWPKYIEFFKPYVGRQVLKQGGALLKKIEDNLPYSPPVPLTRVFRSFSEYTLYWTVVATELYTYTNSREEPDTGNAQYECSFTVGKLQNGILETLNETPPQYRTDYSAENIAILRKMCEKAEKAYREAVASLGPFGEYDR